MKKHKQSSKKNTKKTTTKIDKPIPYVPAKPKFGALKTTAHLRYCLNDLATTIVDYLVDDTSAQGDLATFRDQIGRELGEAHLTLSEIEIILACYEEVA